MVMIRVDNEQKTHLVSLKGQMQGKSVLLPFFLLFQAKL